MRPAGRYTIGLLARQSGVPVKTIRHYSDVGVLPPASVTAAGYRRYDEDDLARLETIRALRAAGFDLATIRRLLDRELGTAEAAAVLLQTLELQERTIRRQRLVLQRTLAEGTLDRFPERTRALALLSAKEREAFLQRHLERGLTGVPVDAGWLAWFQRGAVLDLPEDLSDAQLAAWVELAEMVAEPSFAEAVHAQSHPFWSAAQVAGGDFDLAAWQAAVGDMQGRAAAAVAQGKSPDSALGRELVDRWLGITARAMGRPHDDAFAAWMRHHVERTADPRLGRYWELIATLKGWPAPDQAPQAAWTWLIDALRASGRVDGTAAADAKGVRA